MEIRRNFIGAKSFYFNPSADILTTANLAAIDTAYGSATVSPYAYTATVADTYDSFNFFTSDAGSTIVAGQRVAFGLFLTPENDKLNLTFQVTGKASYFAAPITGFPRGNFFFGRKATDNTVVSNKAAAANTLAKYMLLPKSSSGGVLDPTAVTGSMSIDESIQSEIFSLELSSGFVYCFGYMIDNVSGGNQLLVGGVSLSVRKYGASLPAFSPDRI